MDFNDLFTLELANNHWGSLERGLMIIRTYGALVRKYNIKAAIKLQYRDVDNFIHRDHLNSDARYIKKTLSTRMSITDYKTMVDAIHEEGCLAMCTPFDETSVGWCVETGIDIIKIASSDVTNYFLMDAIAATRKPVIFSTGATTILEIAALVDYFELRHIPVGVNHCVSIYPSEDHQLELNQITFLKSQFPNHTIGFSSHEYHSWDASMHISYALGARMWERHIDIDDGVIPVPAYNSLPHQVEEWFKAYHLTQTMLGGPAHQKHESLPQEVRYVNGLLRGVYLGRDLPEGHVLQRDDFYLAIPLQEGQRSFKGFRVGEKLLVEKKAHEPLGENESV